MNLSVSESTPSADAPAPVTPAPQRPQWVAITVVAAFPLFLALANRVDSFLLSALLLALGYGLGIYAVVTIARTVAMGRGRPVIVANVVAGIISSTICPQALMYVMIMTWLTLTACGLTVGLKARTESRQFVVFLWGAGVALVGAVATSAPSWEMLLGGARAEIPEMLEQLGSTMAAGGYSTAEVNDMVARMGKAMEMVIRIMPAVTVLNVVAQFALAFVWFLGRRRPSTVVCGPLRKFSEWKMPFAAAPILIVLIVARLVGNEMITLVADNLLLGLSIFYCVAGLSFVEWIFTRVKLPFLMKIVFYVMLTITGILGYFATVLVGFIDSFTDWRKLTTPEQST